MSRLPASWITPTAHYTGHVWWRNGLSHPAFHTATGQVFYAALEPINRLSRVFGGSTLEAMLIARHRVIDHLLEGAIASGEVGQVLEVAAGLSPRGLRFTDRFPELVYVEADLPAMAARKRAVLESAGSLSERHPVVEINALSDDGPNTIAAVCDRHFDRERGVAIVTEGLISYFDTTAVNSIWRRFAGALVGFPSGLYLSDLHIDEDIRAIRGGRVFRFALNQLTRGRHHRYYETASAAVLALKDSGFAAPEVHYASDFADLEVPALERSARVRIVEARRS